MYYRNNFARVLKPLNQIEVCGIISQFTPPRMLQRNGVLRKEESDLVGHGLIHDESFKPFTLFLGHALLIETFTLNYVPSKAGIQKKPRDTISIILLRTNYLLQGLDGALHIDQNEPMTYQEVVIGLEFEKWHEVKRSKIESMYTNQEWTLVELRKR
ncbi:hypothetical protein CR513_49057, partial [Mucuna pruriens]